MCSTDHDNIKTKLYMNSGLCSTNLEDYEDGTESFS